MDTKDNMWAKIAKIRSEIGTVAKTGHNEYANYKYVEESGILKALNPLLEKNGLVILQSVEEKKTTIQEKGLFVELKMKYTIIEISTGEKLDLFWHGEAKDSQDKALYKAYTGCNKYFLMKIFGIASGDDPEVPDPGEVKEAKGKTAKCSKCGNPAHFSKPGEFEGTKIEIYTCGKCGAQTRVKL